MKKVIVLILVIGLFMAPAGTAFAAERGIYLAPTFDIANLFDEPHFKARKFWHEIEIQHTKSKNVVRVPGEFAKFSKTPMKLPGVAPELGNANIRNRTLKPLPSSPTSDALPLEGLKVLDFMWAAARVPEEDRSQG